MRRLLPLVLVATSFLVPAPAGRAAGREDLQDTIRRDAEAFLAFADVKTDSLREELGRADEGTALALARRLHAEECRFLERIAWYCRQDRKLAEAAEGLTAYLGSYRGLSPQESLALRRGAQTGRSQVFRVAMSLVSSVAPRIRGSPLAPAAPVDAASGPGYAVSWPAAVHAQPGPAALTTGAPAAPATTRRSVALDLEGEEPVRVVKRQPRRPLDELLPPSTPAAGAGPAGGASRALVVTPDAGDPSVAFASGTFVPPVLPVASVSPGAPGRPPRPSPSPAPAPAGPGR